MDPRFSLQANPSTNPRLIIAGQGNIGMGLAFAGFHHLGRHGVREFGQDAAQVRGLAPADERVQRVTPSAPDRSAAKRREDSAGLAGRFAEPRRLMAGGELHPGAPGGTDPGVNFSGDDEECKTKNGGDEPKQAKAGKYVLRVSRPSVESPRFVHFAWDGGSFLLRDYLGNRLLTSNGRPPSSVAGLAVSTYQAESGSIWAGASIRVGARGEPGHDLTDYAWWLKKLGMMEEGLAILRSPRHSRWTKDAIIESLHRGQRRASYGGIAGVVGGIAYDVMRGRPKSFANSWVVGTKTNQNVRAKAGWPTDYDLHEIDPACLGQIREDPSNFIADPYSLLTWLEETGGTGPRSEPITPPS